MLYTIGMSRRDISLVQDEYYHVYNRGSNKQDIFKDEQDKRHFVKLLALFNQKPRLRTEDSSIGNVFEKKDAPLVAIGAYAIMNNHFHIVLKQLDEKGVTIFMQKIGTAYAMYFNQKYKRTGVLFEGRFKTKHIDDDMYMRYLYAYVHLNPAKLVDSLWKEKILKKRKEVITFIKQYPYSSFHDYCGIVRPENGVLDRNHFPIYFETPKHFTESILSWITINPEE